MLQPRLQSGMGTREGEHYCWNLAALKGNLLRGVSRPPDYLSEQDRMVLGKLKKERNYLFFDLKTVRPLVSHPQGKAWKLSARDPPQNAAPLAQAGKPH